MRNTALQTLGIVIAGLALGIGSNAARTKGHVTLGKNYFRVLIPSALDPPSDEPTDIATARSDGGDNAPSKLPQHGFTPFSLDQAADLFMGAGYASGEAVFVDARDIEHFTEAHIPGAIHIDRYSSDEGFNNAEQALRMANVIVVYCGGGECEDSIYLATELVVERMIPVEAIRLFESGMQAWEGDGLEIEGSEAE